MPSKIEVYASRTVQLNLGQKKCYEFYSVWPNNTIKYEEMDYRNGDKLTTHGLCACYAIIIHDAQNRRFWFMHITPRDYNIHSADYNVLTKKFDSEIPGLDKNNSIDVIVVRQDFNVALRELKSNRVEARINSIRTITPNATDSEGNPVTGLNLKLDLVFDPQLNTLIIMPQGCKEEVHSNIFPNVLPVIKFDKKRKPTLFQTNSAKSTRKFDEAKTQRPLPRKQIK
ncbi:hypothetical protein AYO45_00975 [Gammaproteobacteria bacterium SCGC AG-212-F23]|nr:hypothetical protein AYO45_00975 [Gammaproteobacteria bacterium SCGC AG-212-F23]